MPVIIFSESTYTYWPRCSRGQYGDENNQAGIFEAEGDRESYPGKISSITTGLSLYSTRKVQNESFVSVSSKITVEKRSCLGDGSYIRKPGGGGGGGTSKATGIPTRFAHTRSVEWRCSPGVSLAEANRTARA